MKTKTNLMKVCVMAAVTLTCAGSVSVSAQSDPDENLNSTVTESLGQLNELTAMMQSEILYKAPSAEEENLTWIYDELDNFTSIMAQRILYKAPGDEIAPDTELDYTNQEYSEENLTQLVENNSNNL